MSVGKCLVSHLIRMKDDGNGGFVGAGKHDNNSIRRQDGAGNTNGDYGLLKACLSQNVFDDPMQYVVHILQV